MGIYSVMSSIQYTRIALNYGNGDTGEKPDLFRVSYKPTKGLPETTINDRTKAEAADEHDTVRRGRKNLFETVKESFSNYPLLFDSLVVVFRQSHCVRSFKQY